MGRVHHNHRRFTRIMKTVAALVGMHQLLMSAEAASVFTEWPMQYCHHDLEEFAIPALTANKTDDIQLLQVQTVIRHGARTPLGDCGAGYNVTWHCEVTQLESTVDAIADNNDPSSYGRLYNKHYDAGKSELPEGSTCLTGNLVAEGFEMETANGRHLQEAYVGPGRLHLFESTDLTVDELKEQVYLRSDDQQRTVMSGQVLFNRFFPASASKPMEVMPWHTRDKSEDMLEVNANLCPAINDHMEALEATAEMKDTRRREREALEQTNTGYGSPPPVEAFADFADCQVVTACAGFTTRFSHEQVQQFGSLYEEEYRNYYTLDNSSVAKLGMAPLWREIRGRVRAAVAGEPVHKFVLYSGHDTTIMPMLAAVGGSAYDGAWAPFASMLNLEVYARDNGDHLFRVVYNGRELLFPGCTEALCSVDAFETALAFVEDFTPENCQSTGGGGGGGGHPFPLYATVLLSVVGGMVLGALLMKCCRRGGVEYEEVDEASYSRLNDDQQRYDDQQRFDA